VGAFLAAVNAEIEYRRRDARLRGRGFATLYIGGGTPSVLHADGLRVLLRSVSDSFDFDSDVEVTIEANPESVDPDFAELAAEQPGCRVSLGAQSFDRGVLETLGRIHGPETTRSAFETLREAGVRKINLDLIYGVPGETFERWAASLDEALELEPDHVSIYCLSVEEGTPLAGLVEDGRVPPPDDNLQSEMYAAGRERIERAGLEGYEISNFAAAGSRSRHNRIYWRRGEYLGLGPAAHSFLDGERRCNLRDVERYCRAVAEGEDPAEWREMITVEEALEETVMLALRMSEGLDLEELDRVCGPGRRRDIVLRAERLEREGLMLRVGNRLTIAPKGYFVSDAIIASLLPEAGPEPPECRAPRPSSARRERA
jgi:oxygen-independent coproporphyrinogen-3 oxidase